MTNYAQGGYVGPPTAEAGDPVVLHHECALMSYASYRALGADMREKLKDVDVELVFSADDVRELGPALLDKLNGTE